MLGRASSHNFLTGIAAINLREFFLYKITGYPLSQYDGYLNIFYSVLNA